MTSSSADDKQVCRFTPCPYPAKAKGICNGHLMRYARGKRGKELAAPLHESKEELDLIGTSPKEVREQEKQQTKKQEIQKIVRREAEIASYKGQIKLLNLKYQELLKQSVLQDRILEYNRLAVNALPVVKPPVPFAPTGGKTIESVVSLWSDFHLGEVIKFKTMGGLNKYNFQEFVKRFQFLVEKTISFTTQNMSAHQFEELQILALGDMVSGIIHDELESTNCLNIVEQAHLGALVMAQGLLELARVFPKITMTCISGNHGRVKQKKYFKDKQQVNWDYVLYETLALMLRNQKNVQFRIPLSPWAGVQVQNSRFLIMHGDNIRSWGSIPFYGINRACSKWMEITAVQKKVFQYFVLGHFHNKGVLQSAVGEKIINGSLMGGDEYGIDIGFADPIQMIFGVHPKYGKTWELSINPKFATGPIRYKYDQDKDLSEQVGIVE